MIKLVRFSRSHVRTSFVQLNSRKCKACWLCIDHCARKVIGKVDLPWHKHAIFINANECSGCLKCVISCPQGAFSKIEKCE
jgi:2-oxoglutarate ferredoxin oxidoreductase subunit delta